MIENYITRLLMFRPENYLIYITVYSILTFISLFLILNKIICKDKNKIMIFSIFFLSILSFFILYGNYTNFEEGTYLFMSTCMTNNYYDDIVQCSNGIFGEIRELAWPALISYINNFFGINLFNAILLASIFTGFSFSLCFLILKNFFSKFVSILLLIFLFFIPVNNKYLFSSLTKEPMYHFFVIFALLLILNLNKIKSLFDFFLVGIILSFACEVRIQYLLILPIIYGIIIYHNKNKNFLWKKIILLLLPLFLTFLYKLKLIFMLPYNYYEIFIKSKLTLDYLNFFINSVFFNVIFFIIFILFFLFFIYYFLFKKKILISKNEYYIIFFLIFYNLVMILLLFTGPANNVSDHYFSFVGMTIWILFFIIIHILYKNKIFYLLKKILKKKNRLNFFKILFILIILIFIIFGFMNIFNRINNSENKEILKYNSLNHLENIFKNNQRISEFNSLTFNVSSNNIIYFLKFGVPHSYMEFIYFKDFISNRINFKTFYDCVNYPEINFSCDNLYILGDDYDIDLFLESEKAMFLENYSDLKTYIFEKEPLKKDISIFGSCNYTFINNQIINFRKCNFNKIVRKRIANKSLLIFSK